MSNIHIYLLHIALFFVIGILRSVAFILYLLSVIFYNQCSQYNQYK